METVALKPSEEDDRALLIPVVQPISEITNRDTGEPEVRGLFWENAEKPPTLRTARRVYVIEEFDDLFDDALKDISDANLIGVKLEGPMIKRGGDLHSISFATRNDIYIFDMIKLGARKAFKFGLGYVLKDPAIKKVFHDVRMASNLLHHDYGVELSNVFDTAVADSVVMASHQFKGFKPDFVRSYQAVCMEYLGIPATALFFHVMRTNRFENDNDGFWKLLDGNYKTLAFLRNCMYLLPLYEACTKALLHHLHTGVQAFISQARDIGNYEAERMFKKAEVDRLPVPWEWRDQITKPNREREELVRDGFRVEGDIVAQDVGDYVPHNIYRK